MPFGPFEGEAAPRDPQKRVGPLHTTIRKPYPTPLVAPTEHRRAAKGKQLGEEENFLALGPLSSPLLLRFHRRMPRPSDSPVQSIASLFRLRQKLAPQQHLPERTPGSMTEFKDHKNHLGVYKVLSLNKSPIPMCDSNTVEVRLISWSDCNPSHQCHGHTSPGSERTG